MGAIAHFQLTMGHHPQKAYRSYTMHESVKYSGTWGGENITSYTDPTGGIPSQQLLLSEEVPATTTRIDLCNATYRINNTALGPGSNINQRVDGTATYHDPTGPKNNPYWSGWGNVLFVDQHIEYYYCDEHADFLVIAWSARRGEWEDQRQTQ